MSRAHDDQQLIEKIRAILRKASEADNPSEAERDTALRMANRLLLKHGLSMQDVERAPEDDDRAWEHEGAFTTESEQESWRGVLLHVLADVYFCKSYRIPMGIGVHRHVLIGRVDHTATVKAMYEYIVPQIEREFTTAVSMMSQQHRFARRFALAYVTGAEDLDPGVLGVRARDTWAGMVDQLGDDQALTFLMETMNTDSIHYARKVRAKLRAGEVAPADTDNLGVWRRSFFDGAVSRIGRRLREMMREEVEDLGAPGTALVKSERTDLDAFVQSLDLGLRVGRSNRRGDGAGYAAGKDAGDRADLSGHRKITNDRKELTA